MLVHGSQLIFKLHPIHLQQRILLLLGWYKQQLWQLELIVKALEHYIRLAPCRFLDYCPAWSRVDVLEVLLCCR